MTDYILAATNRYKGNGDELIHPIHTLDGKIISVLTEILRKHGDIAVVDVLEQYYKYEADTEVLRLLKDIEKKLKITVPTQSPDQFPRYHIVNGRRLDLFLLITYDSTDTFNTNGEPLFLITLNPCPEKAKEVPYYANDILYFRDKYERDETLKAFDDFMRHIRGGFLQDFADDGN